MRNTTGWFVVAVGLLVVISGLGMILAHPQLSFSPVEGEGANSGSSPSVRGTVTPFMANLAINPNQVQQGNSISLSTTVSGGTPPMTFSYSGLPPGCSSMNSQGFSCNPSSQGNYGVSAEVTDAHGNQTTSNTVNIDVTASNNGNGNGNGGNGNNSSNSLSSLFSGIGGYLSIVLVFGIIGFITWVLLVVGVWIIAVVLYRRLPKRASGAAAGSAVNCAGCGASIPASSKFCPECGRPTAPKT